MKTRAIPPKYPFVSHSFGMIRVTMLIKMGKKYDNFRKCVQSIPKRGQGLQNINLTIEEGEFVSIIGLSGAGKAPYCARSIV